MNRQILFISAILFIVFELRAQQDGTSKKMLTAFEPVIEVSKIFKEQDLREKMKKDGLTEAVINKLIEGRKKLEAQGRKVEWLSFGKSGMNPVPNALCGDVGVENGWGSWMGATGSNIGGNPAALGTPTVPVTPQFNITSGSGIDPCTPGASPGSPTIPVVASGFGSASIQLGEAQTPGASVEQLTYKFSPTAKDTDFVYSYAFVFYDASSSHAPNEMPFAEFMILDPNGDTVPCSYQRHIAGASIPGYYQANSTCSGGTSTWYKPWTTRGLRLSSYVGMTLTIVITNGDCIQGGHYAHSYWDFSCGFNDINFCTGQPKTVCAPASDPGNPYTYQWYQNGTIIPTGTSQCLSIVPQQSDTLSVYVSMVSGCDYFVNYIMQDSCLIGVAENISMQELTIYPSPASQNIFLDFNESSLGIAEISIYNVLGEEIYQTKFPANGKQVLDVSGYTEGVYFIRINTDAGTVTKKIIISR